MDIFFVPIYTKENTREVSTPDPILETHMADIPGQL